MNIHEYTAQVCMYACIYAKNV